MSDKNIEEVVEEEEDIHNNSKKSGFSITKVLLFIVLCGLAWYLGKSSGQTSFENEISAQPNITPDTNAMSGGGGGGGTCAFDTICALCRTHDCVHMKY
tara:strand:+ start:194 stop:490 length:297 start_codon:yes stop_codon:yes gene_type:complete